MKPCNRCDTWLPSSAFYADTRNADGLAGTCKACQCAAARASSKRRYVPKNTMRQPRAWNGQFARAA